MILRGSEVGGEAAREGGRHAVRNDGHAVVLCCVALLRAERTPLHSPAKLCVRLGEFWGIENRNRDVNGHRFTDDTTTQRRARDGSSGAFRRVGIGKSGRRRRTAKFSNSITFP